MSSLLPSLPPAPVIRPSTELQSDPCCDKAEQVKHEIKPFVDLNHAERSFTQPCGFGRARRPSPWEATVATVAAVFRLRRCLLSSSGVVFPRLSSSKPQHINNICSTPVQAPRDQTHRSYHFFIREQVPHYPTLLGLGD